jgi:nitroreductase
MDSEKMIELILTRRSIRKFKSEPVEEEKLERILKCAAFAPTAKNTKAWKFVVSSDRALIDKVVASHPYSAPLKTAPVMIAVCMDFDKVLPGYAPVDASAATENILLAAHAQGLATCWMGVYPNADRIDALKNILDLDESIDVINLVALGYADEEPRTPGRDYNNYVIRK